MCRRIGAFFSNVIASPRRSCNFIRLEGDSFDIVNKNWEHPGLAVGICRQHLHFTVDGSHSHMHLEKIISAEPLTHE